MTQPGLSTRGPFIEPRAVSPKLSYNSNLKFLVPFMHRFITHDSTLGHSDFSFGETRPRKKVTLLFHTGNFILLCDVQFQKFIKLPVITKTPTSPFLLSSGTGTQGPDPTWMRNPKTHGNTGTQSWAGAHRGGKGEQLAWDHYRRWATGLPRTGGSQWF